MLLNDSNNDKIKIYMSDGFASFTVINNNFMNYF